MFHLYLDYKITPVATESDILGRAYVHYKAWHETYSRIIDPKYLNEVHTYKKCEQIARRGNDNVLIAKVGERVAGFVAFGPYRDDTLADTGEIYAIYVLSDCQGYGIGGALMKAAFDRLTDYSKIALWVLERNENAIQVYEHCGFRPDGVSQEILLGTSQTEIRMILDRQSVPLSGQHR